MKKNRIGKSICLFVVIITFAISCSKSDHSSNSSSQDNPEIISFSPESASTGTSVTIYGKNLDHTSEIKFGNNSAASFMINSSTSITAVVGDGASGSVLVITDKGNASRSGFTYLMTTVNFTSVGVNTFTVPKGVANIHVQLYGPGGWSGGMVNINGVNYNNGAGGSGGYVSGTLMTTSGETLTMFVAAGGGQRATESTYIKRGDNYIAVAASGGNGSATGGHGGAAGLVGEAGTNGSLQILTGGTAGAGATASAGGIGGLFGSGSGGQAGQGGGALAGGSNNSSLTGDGWGGHGWFGGGASGTFTIDLLQPAGPFASGGGGGGANYSGGLTGAIISNSSGSAGGASGGLGVPGKIIITY